LYSATQWRQSHPSWNGHYYYHGGHYYYDPGFTIGASISNEWTAIAIGVGGVSLLVSLNSDPYLVFGGEWGQYYPYSLYEVDLNSPIRWRRLRARYFARTYFWRNGVEFHRHTVVRGGKRFYRFSRG